MNDCKVTVILEYVLHSLFSHCLQIVCIPFQLLNIIIAAVPVIYLHIVPHRGLLLPKIVVDDFGGTRTDPGMLGSGIYFASSSR